MTDENTEATHIVSGPSITLGGTTYYRDDPVAPSESALEAHADFFDPLPEGESKTVRATVRTPSDPEDLLEEDADLDENEGEGDESEEDEDAVESTMDLDYDELTVKEIRAAVAEHEPSDAELRSLLDHEESREEPRSTLTTLYKDRLGIE